MKKEGMLGTLRFMVVTILLLVLTSSAVIITVLNKYKPAVKVYVGKDLVGYFSSEQQFSQIYNDLVNEKEKNGVEVKVYLENEPTFENSYIKDEILQEQNVYTNLRAVLKTEYITYKVAVNNETEMTFTTQDEAKKYVDEIKNEVANLDVKIKEEKSEELEEITTIERADNILQDIVDRNKPVEIPDKSLFDSDVAVTDTNDSFKNNGIWPTDARYLTSYFGWRWGSFHSGTDIAGSVGTPIYAFKDGVVTYSGWASSYGYMIKIDHGNGYSTWYAHCSNLIVNIGDTVKQGQKIGLMGSTGFSTGSHLHFEVRINGVPVNSLAYIYPYI